MSYIFTSTPSNARQATSQLFSDYGNPGQIPGPVGSSGIIGVPVNFSWNVDLLQRKIAFVLAAFMGNKNIPLHKEYVNIATLPSAAKSTVLDPPEIVTSFDGRELQEQVVQSMTDIGFRKESSARQQYYKGPATPTAVNTIIKANGDLDTYAPYGLCNIRGYIAFNTIQKILLSTATMLSKPWTLLDTKDYFDKDVNLAIPYAKKNRFVIKDANGLIGSGAFLPYFPGLVLPDKDTPFNLFVKLYGRGLGNSMDEMAKNIKNLREGWKSLSTTPQGLILSHLIFAMDLAFTTGGRLVIYMPGGQYCGVVIRGSELLFLKSQTIFRSLSAEALKEAVQNFDQHESKLKIILDLINPLLFKGSSRTNYLSNANIATPRRLHNLLRTIKLEPDDLKTVRSALSFLRFNQILWNATNDDNIIAAAQSIANEEFLPDHFPIVWKSEAFLSKDIALSTLGAFGVQAPSLCGVGSNYSIPIHSKGPSFQTNMPNGVVLRGLPIFVKPLQAAAEDWKEMRRIGAIRYKTGILDKEQYTRLPGVSRYISFDDRESKSIISSLAPFSAKKKEENSRKRARDQHDQDEPASKTARDKRLRTIASEDANIMDFLIEGIQDIYEYNDVMEE